MTLANLKITGCKNGSALTVGVEEDSLQGHEETARRDNAKNNGRLEGEAPQFYYLHVADCFLVYE